MNYDFLNQFGIATDAEQLEKNSHKHVIVGMSGGVDSSVSALILKAQGFKVTALFMKNWEDDDEFCSAQADYLDVIKVCEKIDIPYYSIDFVSEYKDNVFSFFLDEYKNGRTPNPDILCNKEIKFKVFYDQALSLGADFLATGHYCQNINNQLVKAVDHNKDQTYFLYAINPEVLNKTIFPIGGLTKPEVRKIAKYFGLNTFNKKDSTGICFIGERHFKNFLSQYIKEQAGYFVNFDNNQVIKQHDGHCFYTIGQRKGLGIGGPGGPWFVVKKDAQTNTVFVVEGEDHDALYSKSLYANNITWLVDKFDPSISVRAKIRYRQSDQECSLEFQGDCVFVTFENYQRAISVGQSIVFYQGDICIGGAIIDKVGPSRQEDLSLPELRV